MQYGRIKFYNPERGFGFIRPPSGEDIFFHVSELPPNTIPTDGMTVEYTLGERNSRIIARDVRPLEEVGVDGN